MLIQPEVTTLIGALGGAIIGAASGIIISWLNKRSEERKHLRALMVNAAIENWKHISQLLASKDKAFRMQPLTTFIVHMTALADICIDSKLTNRNLSKKLDEIAKITFLVEDHVKEMQEKRNSD